MPTEACAAPAPLEELALAAALSPDDAPAEALPLDGALAAGVADGDEESTTGVLLDGEPLDDDEPLAAGLPLEDDEPLATGVLLESVGSAAGALAVAAGAGLAVGVRLAGAGSTTGLKLAGVVLAGVVAGVVLAGVVIAGAGSAAGALVVGALDDEPIETVRPTPPSETPTEALDVLTEAETAVEAGFAVESEVAVGTGVRVAFRATARGEMETTSVTLSGEDAVDVVEVAEVAEVDEVDEVDEVVDVGVGVVCGVVVVATGVGATIFCTGAITLPMIPRGTTIYPPYLGVRADRNGRPVDPADALKQLGAYVAPRKTPRKGFWSTDTLTRDPLTALAPFMKVRNDIQNSRFPHLTSVFSKLGLSPPTAPGRFWQGLMAISAVGIGNAFGGRRAPLGPRAKPPRAVALVSSVRRRESREAGAQRSLDKPRRHAV